MVTKMAESNVLEFPFVAAMPRAEKSRLAKVWDMFHTMNELAETGGNLIPVSLACKLLDISRTRVDELCAKGRLERHVIDGHCFITGRSITDLAKSDRNRKGGRPPLVGNDSIFKNTPSKNNC